MDKEQDWAIQSIQVKKTVPLEGAQEIYKKIVKKKPRKVREKGEWMRFRVIPPTKFEPKSFRTKVVNDDIHIIFGVIKSDNKKLVGAGMWDYFQKAYDYVATKASDAFDYVKKAVSITDFSDKTKKFLQQYGNLPILAIELRRAPLNVAIDLALQGVSTGKWMELKKKYGFDEFFHLSMLVTVGGAVERKLRNGRLIKEPKKLAIEKLAVVSINENITIEPDMETLPVSVPKPFTINEMFSKAREKYGDSRFFSYSALGNNNCQNFIQMLLEVEGLYSEEAKRFVFQDISQLVKELPEATKTVSQGLTDIGALASKYLGIGGSKKKTGKGREEDIDFQYAVEAIMEKHEPIFRDNIIQAIERFNKTKKRREMTLPFLNYSKAVLSDPDLNYKNLSKKDKEYVNNQLLHFGDKYKWRVKRPVNPLASQFDEEEEDEYEPDFIVEEDEEIPEEIDEKKGDGKPENKKSSSNKRMSLDDLYNDLDNPRGGNRSAGFIRALMARDSQNPDVRAKWEANEVKNPRAENVSSTQANRKKFEGVNAVKVEKLSKTTHNLLDTRKSMTRNQAIKSFYQYVKDNASAHEPSRANGVNFVGTYDLDNLYDQWKASQGGEVRAERAQRRQQGPVEVPEQLFDEKEEEIPEPPSADNVFSFVRDNGVAELKRRLRGKTAEELIAFYRKGSGATREKLRKIATAVGATHRRPPDARGDGAITIQGVAQNIVEKVR